MRAEYREEPCRNALNRVRGMPFAWSLNPYMGCAHRCTFCYVRAFEARADRPWDDRYGSSIRVKTNVAEMLRRELARRSWQREPVAVGAAGATGIWANLLYLRPGTREHFLSALERDWPQLLPEYERRYRGGAYLPRRETASVRDRVRKLARSQGIRDRRRVRLAPASEAEQLQMTIR